MEKIAEEIARMKNNNEANGAIKFSDKKFSFSVTISDNEKSPKPADIEIA